MLPYLSQPLCKTWRVVVHRITQPRFRLLCSGATYRVFTLSFSALAANIVARASRIWDAGIKRDVWYQQLEHAQSATHDGTGAVAVQLAL